VLASWWQALERHASQERAIAGCDSLGDGPHIAAGPSGTCADMTL
jgi:hypothetical protein